MAGVAKMAKGSGEVQELQEVNTYITGDKKVIVSRRLQLFHSATPDS
jgi:hypothetical protein